MGEKNLGRVWAGCIQDFRKMTFSEESYDKDIFYNWLKNERHSGKALDQGSGTGLYTIMLDRMGFDTTGIEISKPLIEECLKNKKRFNCHYRIIHGDVRTAPFKDECFDLVLSGGVIEHFPETQKALDEQYRILKKGGKLLIHVPHRISIFTITKIIQKFLGLWTIGYEKSFTIWDFKKRLRKAGFKIKKFKLRKVSKGKSGLVYMLLRVLNTPLEIIGLGGHHMFFYCVKYSKSHK